MRLAIINHETHTLFVEDVDENIINEHYNGNEEDYIKDNYNLDGKWSWDYIIDAEYIPIDDSMPVEIDFENL